MPSPTRNQSMRHLMALMMAMMGILFCLMGLAILQNFDDVAPQPPKKRKKKVVRRNKKKTGHAKNPPTTGPKISQLNTLPVELLRHIFEYLAPNNVQPHLDSTAFHAYKQSQNDLRSVCLVSKLMDAVARPYLYRAVIVNNVDVLAYLLRTLDEVQALGQNFNRLVLEVPFTLEDEQYQKPDVSVLASRPNYSHIYDAAAEASDVTRYEQQLGSVRSVLFEREISWTPPTFREWAWIRECKILGIMHFEILQRANNLQSLCFGMICSASPNFVLPYSTFFGHVRHAMARREGIEVVHPFMPKLLELQLLGNKADGQGPYSASFPKHFLEIPSLRALQSVHDDGDWFDLDPHQGPELPMPLSSRQYKNITSIDLKRSHCTPQSIFQICTTFPALEYLAISVDHGTSGLESRINGFSSQGSFLSTELAKLEHLKELVLNLHYKHDVKAALGQHGVLNLVGLNKLVNVRLPLHFLVEMQPGKDPFVTDPGHVLPSSLKYLTVWADMGAVSSWGVTDWFANHPRTGPFYYPSQLALDFLGSVSARITDHFNKLKEVTYCYRDEALRETCQCDPYIFCSHCDALGHLDPYEVLDSSALIQVVCSRLDTRGVRLRFVEEQAEG